MIVVFKNRRLEMEASPAAFVFALLCVSFILWLIIIFASRQLAWALSRVMGASVGFQVGGWNCLRNVVVKFKKGAVESIAIGEIKLGLRQSGHPKLQILICGLEVVMGASNKSAKKSRSRKSSGSGKGKLAVVANMARFLTVTVTELVFKSPKANVEVKEISFDISKDGGSQPAFFVKLHIFSISVDIGESRVNSDFQSAQSRLPSFSQTVFGSTDRTPAPFNCEEFSLLCELSHDMETDISIKNVDVTFGEVFIILSDKLIFKKKSDTNNNPVDIQVTKEIDGAGTSKKPDKKPAILAVTKFTSMFPEKVGFTLPKLDVKFVNWEHALLLENKIMGIQLQTSKSRSVEDPGESTKLDLQMEFSEIHLLQDAGISVVEIMKLVILSTVYIPLQPASTIRSEIDIKLGGTQLNLTVSKLVPWMSLRPSKTKKSVSQEKSLPVEKPKSTEQKTMMWTCTVSAPEITIVIYNLSGSPVFHGCSQSTHIFANNVSSTGTAVHMELGELNLHLSDEYQEGIKESLFGVETTAGSLLHIAKFSLNLGKKDMDSPEEGSRCKMVLSSEVFGLGFYFTYRRLESLISTAFAYKALFKKFSDSSKKPANSMKEKSSRPSGKGIQLVKFNLERCTLNFNGDVGLEKVEIEDPKRVNYGSQGGRVVISVSADGTPRTAQVMSTSDMYSKLKYSVSLDIFHLGFSMNKEKQSTQVEVERARSIYQEHLDDSNPESKVVLLDMQNAKLVRRSGGLKEVVVYSLFSATDISVRWEPDLHLALIELSLQLKSLIHTQKLQVLKNEETISETTDNKETEIHVESSQSEKQQKKKESIFAIDVEMLRISAEAGDGVETMVEVQSIFSENSKIGVLLEGLIFIFNDARIFRSSRMQLSRVPSTSCSSSDPKTETVTAWDWVIQALDVQICLPYRLELRAIDDSVEEMLRALKLVTAARTKVIFPFKKDGVKPKKISSTKIGCVRFCTRKLAADIEEEPFQGWLDEHYRLLKNIAWETAVRLNFLDDILMKAGQTEKNDSVNEGKFCFEGEEININDNNAIEKLRNEIYKQSFHAYYRACQNLVPSDGSGAYRKGFQSGFKLSTGRTSLMSLSATEFDVTLRRIDRGDAGMIEVLQKLDPVCCAHNIPFSRLYGSNFTLSTGSLVARIRDYTCPLFSGTSGKCEGRLILAQQATCFQPQIHQEVYIGKWRNVCLLRSATGTTPPMKTFMDLPLHFQKAEVSFGVGFEPSFTDLSYAFTVALRRANLSIRNPNPLVQPPKKEKSLPWWDEMRNYIHGHATLFISETKWNVLASTDPYEFADRLEICSGHMEIQQSDGRIFATAKDFKVLLSSLESLLKNSNLKQPPGFSEAFLVAPTLSVEVIMEWECESGNPLNHYLFALPIEGEPRHKIFDPFRSTSLSLRWNLSLRPSYLLSSDNGRESSSKGDGSSLDESACGLPKSEHVSTDFPTVKAGPHDFAWLIKFWNLNYLPPYKLRTFSRWPRFGVPRIPRSGNLPMDKVMTEFMFGVDVTPTCIKYIPIDGDDPAKGLTIKMNKLKYEMYFGRGKQKFTFDCKRELLDLVYQGVDLHIPKVFIDKENSTSVAEVVQMTRKGSMSASGDRITNDKSDDITGSSERQRDDGFFLSSDCFTIRKQAPKADPERLVSWQEEGKRNFEMTDDRSEFENESESDDRTRSDPSDDRTRSDASDDEGHNTVIADNCLRVFVYGLKILWNLENRDAVFSFAGELSKAFQPPKPSPSRQYVQRKLLEEKNKGLDEPEMSEEEKNKSSPVCQDICSSSPRQTETSISQSPTSATKTKNFFLDAMEKSSDDPEQEGTRHFMVNVIEPQFNLHSEEANGRFLLAAASGRVLTRSFHSVLQIGHEMIEQALSGGNANVQESHPEMTWTRMEFSVMLEHVQAHVAPTDVDPGAGVQWLPKIRRSSPKVKRTGALLERVFMPCDMFFRYTRHKGGRTDLKVKPLKELTFNSHNITAAMTSRQFQVMLDVLTNLLFARTPKPRKSSLSFPTEDDDVEEEADVLVPDGVEEVELAKVELEQKERSKKIILDDISKLSVYGEAVGDQPAVNESDLWMITGGRAILVQKLKKELENAKKSRKAASASLRTALQKAAQQRLMEKDKNKSPSYAMRVSLQINKVGWSMLVDGKSFAEFEINDMIYDFERDYKDVGVARFTIKYLVIRNWLPNAKSDTLLAAWNPPPEWGKKVMLRVDAKQGVPKEGQGHSPLELFQVDIYPLKIHLAESMYRMIWGYFFPEEKQRQEVWKMSTTAGTRRAKKGLAIPELSVLSAFQIAGTSSKSSTSSQSVTSGISQIDSSQPLKSKNTKNTELRRTASFDRTWEESVAESIANELVLQAHSTGDSFGGGGGGELPDESFKSKSKDSKSGKSARTSLEEKKSGKVVDDKRSSSTTTTTTRPKTLREFHNIKISQVELIVTYEGSRFAVSDLRLLMDTFHRVEFTGTWRQLFSRVKKHIIWGVLKSVTGMQGKKFKDVQNQKEVSIPDIADLNLSDSDGDSAGKSISWPKRPTDGAGDGFVTSVKGLFSSQRKKAKAFVLRTMRGEAENDIHADWSDSEAEFSPFARQLTVNKAKKLIRRHTKKFGSRGQKGSSSAQKDELPSSPTELKKYDSDSSSETSPYDDFNDEKVDDKI